MVTAIVIIGIVSVAKRVLDCFIAGTLVATGYGLTKIEDIKVGDKVWSYNEKTKQKELKIVKNIFRNKTKSWMHIYVYNKETNKEEEIICTPSHKIYIVNRGWIEAKNILENDKVLSYNNTIRSISKIYKEELTEEQTTYNFEVEDNHNYYVSNGCVLVHNQCDFNEFVSNEVTRTSNAKKTNKEIIEMARRLNYKKTNELSHGELVFYNRKATKKLRYISYDNTSHNGGIWKAASSVKELSSKTTRSGTYSELLRWIDE